MSESDMAEVDYEEEDYHFGEAVSSGAGHAGGGDSGEDGEILLEDVRSHERIPRRSQSVRLGGSENQGHDELQQLANKYNMDISVIRTALQCRHDINEDSLKWVALSIDLDVARGPKEQYKAWKERVAQTAHARGLPHPWDTLLRFKSNTGDLR